MSFPYGATVLDHFRHPRNYGSLDAPDRVHEGFNPLCGDRIRIELGLEGETIRAARFKGDACAISTAAASILTGLVQGLDLAAAEAFSAGELLAALGAEIERQRQQCALLPLEVLRAAIRSGEAARR